MTINEYSTKKLKMVCLPIFVNDISSSGVEATREVNTYLKRLNNCILVDYKLSKKDDGSFFVTLLLVDVNNEIWV